MRAIEIIRNTRETQIKLALEFDKIGDGKLYGTSGIGFFDHMLNSFAVHGGYSISLDMTGDLVVDGHHTVEDVGIVLGKSFADILGDKSSIKRFGSSYVPMDESLAFTAVDISGRPYIVYDVPINSQFVGDFDTSLTKEFFRAFAFNLGATLHIKSMYGENSHHIIEAVFKSVARAVSEAITVTDFGILSAKGVL